MKSLKKLLPYIISFALGLAVFIAIICSNKIWTMQGGAVYGLLSDACMVPGVIIGGVGLLVFASNGGAFDMLAYGFIHIFDLFRPNARNERYRNYYEYKQAKSGRKRPIVHMLVVGVIFIVLSAIFAALWY